MRGTEGRRGKVGGEIFKPDHGRVGSVEQGRASSYGGTGGDV